MVIAIKNWKIYKIKTVPFVIYVLAIISFDINKFISRNVASVSQVGIRLV